MLNRSSRLLVVAVAVLAGEQVGDDRVHWIPRPPPVTLAALFTLSPVSHANPPEAQATYPDIQKTLGLVPGFLRAFPETGIAAAWDELKSVQLNPNSALPGKTKELIGLAVAATVASERRCHYAGTQI